MYESFTINNTMKLHEVLDSPEYSLILPVSKKEVKYRPFKYKQQRILLQAQEEKDSKNIILAIYNLLKYCTFDQVDIDKLDIVDFQYLFLKLRSSSAGSNLDINVKCTHCGEYNEIHSSIDDVEIIFSDKEIENPIRINSNTLITLSYPSLQAIEMTDTIEIIKSCIKNIIYKDTVFDFQTQSDEEIIEFFDNMTESQLNLIKEFLENAPKINLPIEFDCVHCNKHNSIKSGNLIELFI